MARNTEVHTVLPATGGLNTSVDAGVIPDNDLINADNVVFSTSGARIKREGFDYFDSNIPDVLAKQSSGTTRTIVFRSAINSVSDDILVVGEKITVAGDSNYNGNFTVASVTSIAPSAIDFVDGDVSAANDTINETGHGFYTGMECVLTTTGTLPTGLATGTTYYIIVDDADTIKLAESYTNAVAGTAIDITAAAGGGTHTITNAVPTNNAITYTASTSVTESLIDATGVTVTKNYSYIGVHDYWYVQANAKTQEIIAVSDEPKLYTFDINGNRKEINADAGATALSSPTRANFLVANNTLIISFDGATNTPKKYAPVTSADWFDLGGSPPNFEIAQLHLGRVFTNDKSDKDRLHYSPPGAIETWNGEGDSGAIDIFPGDGDPAGIISIGRPFKGRFFVSKRGKIVDLRGDAPENFRPIAITEGLGMVNHAAIVPVDMDDLAFVSDRGFHSLAATDTQGDFEGSFLSTKIQKSFNEFVNSRIDYVKGAYLPDDNSIAFAVSEESSQFNNSIYLFNTVQKEWYRWPNLNAQSLTTLQKNTRQKTFLIGTNDGRVITTNNGSSTDFGSSGPAYVIKTGQIYPANDPQSIKLFKRLTLYYKSTADFSFTVTYKIDNNEEASLTYTQSPDTDLLGSTFVLGSSVLGTNSVLAPHSKQIEGIGRGISFQISSSTTASPIEIYGYSIEWEPADLNQEVLGG